jgi:hypothetical protein
MIEASEAPEREQQGLATVVTIAGGVDRAVRCPRATIAPRPAVSPPPPSGNMKAWRCT